MSDDVTNMPAKPYLLGGTRDDALQRVGDLLLGDLCQRAARREDGGLVEEVLQGGAGEPGGAAGDLSAGSDNRHITGSESGSPSG